MTQTQSVDVENTLKAAFYTLRELLPVVKDGGLTQTLEILGQMIADEQEGTLQ